MLKLLMLKRDVLFVPGSEDIDVVVWSMAGFRKERRGKEPRGPLVITSATDRQTDTNIHAFCSDRLQCILQAKTIHLYNKTLFTTSFSNNTKINSLAKASKLLTVNKHERKIQAFCLKLLEDRKQ